MKKFIKFMLIVFTIGFASNMFGAELHPVINTAVSHIDQTGTAVSEYGLPGMAFAAVAKKELREKELIKHFRHKGSWLERIPSKQQWVDNDVIKINEEGADPEVLINNNTYPIQVSQRPDGSIVLELYKYDTTNTVVTDDEIYALPYDKKGSVQRQHRETLEEFTEEHALHSLAPMEDTADTPVLETSGPDDGTGRKRLVKKDIRNLMTKLNKLKVPKQGRILVLSPEHLDDLLEEDADLYKNYLNHEEGKPSKKLYTFELYDSVFAPQYDGSTKQKIPFNSATVGKEASVAIYLKGSAKARGSVKVYMREAKNDPENRQSVIGMRLYFLAIPYRKRGQGAIISASV